MYVCVCVCIHIHIYIICIYICVYAYVCGYTAGSDLTCTQVVSTYIGVASGSICLLTAKRTHNDCGMFLSKMMWVQANSIGVSATHTYLYRCVCAYVCECACVCVIQCMCVYPECRYSAHQAKLL